MCGICGLVRANPAQQIDSEALQRMNAALRHRGPDDEGVWTGMNAGLAARRLSVIDPEHGHQPMATEDDGLVVVLNGEIYNAPTLREDLEKRGVRFRTHCDTEVALRAFEAYGDDAVHRFNGMFAVAVYDTNRGRLFLARDRLGIKPVYYAARSATFAFASELDALLRSGLVSGKINPAALDAYFRYLYIPWPDSIFDSVQKLGPGQYLVYENGTLKITDYWKPPFEIDSSWRMETAAERYRDLLMDAVRLQRLSDVPLGAFLSGGVDSSTVVACLCAQSNQPVKTYSIGFDDKAANELPYARLVTDRLGTEHTEAIVRPDLVELLPDIVQRFGEPFADSSAIPTWLVSKLARESVTVALSGDGGDELFAGYSWLHMNRRVRAYARAPRPIRVAVDRVLRTTPSTPATNRFRRFSADSFRSPIEGFQRRQTCFEADQLDRLYRPETSSAVQAVRSNRFMEHFEEACGLSDDDGMLYHDLRMYLPDDILTKVDRMSMAVSLEARVPLLDHRLVEFAGTVPFSLKYHAGISKRLVKHAFRHDLPGAILRQRKRGFSVPIHAWMRGALRSHFEDVVLSREARCGRYLDMNTCEAIHRSHAEMRENYGHHLWTLLVFEHWLRHVESIPGLSLQL